MGYFKNEEAINSSGFIYVYSGISQYELEKAIDAAMTKNEYIHLGQGVYEKGSRIKRLLFGAFCKYYKFKISINASDTDNIKVRVISYSTGLSGGLIGLKKVKDEIKYLQNVYKNI